MLVVIIIGFIGYSIYNTWSLKDKIYCTFIGQDGTQVHKYAKVKQSRIDWNGSWYNLNPGRITLKLVWMGIIPTWVRCLIFKWDSNMPLDPKTWNNDYDNPRDRKALNRTEDLQSLMLNNKKSLINAGGKKSPLEQFLPIIMIIGIVGLGLLVYQQKTMIDKLGNGQNYIEQQVDGLQRTIDSKLK